MLLMAVPLGLGAGAVDAGLNNYVALHCEAKHMSWLHCFWGIGATAGPIVMAFWIDRNNNCTRDTGPSACCRRHW